MTTLIRNCTIINEGISFRGGLLIDGSYISEIFCEPCSYPEADKIVFGEGLIMMPGLIDDQVHFREPGNSLKGTIESESKAAILGGVTSFMEMPNTNPPAVTLEELEKKYSAASDTSYANYSFYLGGSNDNLEEILNADPENICGIKLFMGSSTGNMLVDNPDSLEKIFSKSRMTIATHCEEEKIIQTNLQNAREKFGENIPFSYHPVIRSRESCIQSTKKALELALRNNASLHILHISTREELELIREAQQINPEITGEVCIHYMLLDSSQYEKYGSRIKCNPAIKEREDRDAIISAVKNGIIKVVATDHAPHTIEEKKNGYLSAPSGLPLIQHSFQIMWKLHLDGHFTIFDIADRMAHSPADRFRVKQRGYIREGYYADLFLFNPEEIQVISKENIAYKCNWSPFEGEKLPSRIVHTFVNGVQVVEDGKVTGSKAGMRLKFKYEK